ncbi:hypothetical protein Nepgr_002692 [Nepenthes gracilis]|uniref:Uncharacterized protein n=1 Tax=Nepenthes gracilis TaxID=150966 RepID=A0AAD3P7G0_NEPGR|nr:hypothetical protein Nepgr_002692 [Nepenthes gracilis]
MNCCTLEAALSSIAGRDIDPAAYERTFEMEANDAILVTHGLYYGHCQGGKSPRNSKSNSVLQMKDAGTVQDSNSFAALQSSEADLLDSLPERSGNSDINLLVEPEPNSNLGDELADPECLPLPDKEVETLDELPLDIETAGLAGGSRIQGPSSCEPPLPKVANLVEVPPGPSSTSVSAAPRSSCMARRMLVDSPSHPVNLPLAQEPQHRHPSPNRQTVQFNVAADLSGVFLEKHSNFTSLSTKVPSHQCVPCSISTNLRSSNILASVGTKVASRSSREYTSASAEYKAKNLHSNEPTATSIFLNLLLNQPNRRSFSSKVTHGIRKPTSSSHFNPRKWLDRAVLYQQQELANQNAYLAAEHSKSNNNPSSELAL